MSSEHPIRREWSATLRLALPIIAGHLGQMAFGLVDSIMIGQLGAVPLAASGFANALLSTLLIVGIGLLTGVAVRSAFQRGAGDRHAVGEALRHGLLLALGAGLLGAAALHGISAHLERLGQPNEVAMAARIYVVIVGWSLVPCLVSIALKHHLEALGRAWMPMQWVLIGVLLNVIINWILIYGRMGAPALGLEGAAWATLISRVVTLLGMAADYARMASFSQWRPQRWWASYRRAEFAALFAVGWPTAAQMFFEVGLFNTAALMMGSIGVNPLAAHQIALSCAATTFMFPLGISQALAVRISAARGSDQGHRVRAIGFGGIAAGAAVMLLCALVMITARRPIAAFFIEDAEVIALASQLLVMAGVFQLFDGTQVTAIGALRGLGDVRGPTLITCAGYWALALPTAWMLGLHSPMGPHGVWTGLTLGLMSCAALLLLRFHRRSRRAVAP